MTVFIRAAKRLMLQCLDKSMEDSSAKNQSWFGGFRNAELSEAQKELTLKLRRQIDDFVPKETDLKSLLALKKAIAELDAEVEGKRKEYQYARGNLNTTLTEMNSNLERFYNTISTLSFKTSEATVPFPLNDIENSKHPFNILCAHAAYYFGENIFNPVDEGYIVKAVSSLVGATSTVSVREHKEACLLSHLKKCDDLLKGVKEGDEYDGMRQELVLREVDAIKRENAEICRQAQPITSVPVSLSFFATANVKAPTLKPSRGRLEVCMQHVLEEIASLKKPVVTEPLTL
ncbi:hypothetical protein [Legionella longbeachae]|uniref:Putative coiled-coil protein n=1 Tax=Legionella longbeachae serogroup 1 (strain NSW150) TaxID=661367 RepID=D3HNQ4_LEGLN|nr:hypothetical protein [Legionella longbeachae]VEE01043.1 coiled-coil protein [Legionella oakridgensis]HBD7398515.1 hypothetical protein [Legionella pneumophila]ARB92576.1 hypothetical protein A6J40_10495 [Legionella longbeachae]ARM34248.1 hypothetical protein B0B39_12230 [Legionella longbeachae]EEZ96489.1 hypothetical protein LLB_1684 [Legionella longbeachae D-4968]